MDNAEPSDNAKVRACELLGKSVGLFKDVQVQTTPPRSAEEITEELERHLAELTDPSLH